MYYSWAPRKLAVSLWGANKTESLSPLGAIFLLLLQFAAEVKVHTFVFHCGSANMGFKLQQLLPRERLCVYMCVGRMLDWGELEITATKDDERHSDRSKIGI